MESSSLKRNVIIISIANLGNKFIAFILAPIYSYFLTTAEYGIMDLIVVSVTLIMPAVCLNIYESTFRFSNDQAENPAKIISTTLFIGVLGCGVTLFILSGISFVMNKATLIYVALFVLLDAVNNILGQFARGRGKVNEFAFGGVVNSIFTLAFNAVFMVFLKKGLDGWMISFLMGKIGQFLFLCITQKIRQYLSVSNIDRDIVNRALKFSLPLIPTTIMWWVMNASDRYAINFVLGTASVGVYAVATKIPSLLSLVENIFYQAWQMSAIAMKDETDRDKKYSVLLEQYFKVLMIGTICLLVFVKPLMIHLFESSYNEAWIYVAPLILAVVFHAISGFTGAFYTVFKYTKGALYTTIIGAISKLVLVVALLPVMGLMAAPLTTLLAYILTTAVRFVNTKHLVKLRLRVKELGVYLVIALIQIVLYYIPGWEAMAVRGMIAVVVLFNNRELLLSMLISRKRGRV